MSGRPSLSLPLNSFPASESKSDIKPTTFIDGPPWLASTTRQTTPQSSALETIASISNDQTVFITTIITNQLTPSLQPTTITPRPPPAESARDSTNASAIAGGSIGGFVFVSAIIIFFWRLRRKRQLKEKRLATLPPPYGGGDEDMSEQLHGTASAVIPETKATVAGTTSSESIEQLDSVVVVPTNEANVEPLGNIPELPATEKNLDQPTDNSAQSQANQEENFCRSSHEHATSGMQFNSLDTRDISSRLFRPHMAPDANVWENMRPHKQNQHGK